MTSSLAVYMLVVAVIVVIGIMWVLAD